MFVYFQSCIEFINSITSNISSEPSHSLPHHPTNSFIFPFSILLYFFSHISTLLKWTCHTECHIIRIWKGKKNGNRSSRKRKKYYDSMNDCSLYLIAWVEFIQMTCFNPHTFPSYPALPTHIFFLFLHDSSFSL